MGLLDTLKGLVGLGSSTPPSAPPAPVQNLLHIPLFDQLNPQGQAIQAPLLPSAQLAPPAAAMNPNNILTDAEFVDCSSMTEKQIQDLIAFKGSFLKDYQINGHLPSYWVYKYCNDMGLNPKVLLTNIQKEQGTITMKTFPKNQRRLDYFAGVGAFDPPRGDDPKWKGVDNQIRGSVIVSTKRFKGNQALVYPLHYTTDRPESRQLRIENAATMSLYNYTPFVGDQDVIIGKNKYEAPFGNAFFFVIYQRWFGFKK